MKNPELSTLIRTIESVHSLTVYYSSLIKDTDVFKHFEVNGIKMNSLYWLTAHIANSESLLLLKALGGKHHNVKWLEEYDYGSSKDLTPTVTYKELVQIAKEIHTNSIAFLKTLNDEDLQKDNLINFTIEGSSSFKNTIIHHIRHQGIHTGHLSTLCLLNKVKTF